MIDVLPVSGMSPIYLVNLPDLPVMSLPDFPVMTSL